MLVLNHHDRASVELLRRCCGNQWAQIAEKIYNYYKADTGELSAVISTLGQFNLNSGRKKRPPPAPSSGQKKAKGDAAALLMLQDGNLEDSLGQVKNKYWANPHKTANI